MCEFIIVIENGRNSPNFSQKEIEEWYQGNQDSQITRKGEFRLRITKTCEGNEESWNIDWRMLEKVISNYEKILELKKTSTRKESMKMSLILDSSITKEDWSILWTESWKKEEISVILLRLVYINIIIEYELYREEMRKAETAPGDEARRSPVENRIAMSPGPKPSGSLFTSKMNMNRR